MEFSEVGIDTEIREAQALKAAGLIAVTVVGIVMEVSLEYKKA